MERESLVFAGCIVTQMASRAPFMDVDLVPPRLWTASACVAPMVPGISGLAWATVEREQRLAVFRSFGMSDERLDDAVAWTTSRFDVGNGWPGIFMDVDTARAFVQRFIPAGHEARVIALCLAVDDVAALIEAASSGSETADVAILVGLRRGAAPPPGGIELGTDVLGLEVDGSFHSFLCNGRETWIRDHLGAVPNTVGLFDDHEVARRAALHIEADGGAEPVPWRAWRLIAYPRQATPSDG